MKKIVLLFLLMTAPAFAAQCLTSVDGTTSVTTDVTTGTNVQISVTPSGDCSSGEVTLQLTYANCSLSVSDPPSPGYYSGVSTGTAKQFTVTSGSAGVCTITARGSTSDGSVDDNTPVILEFVDPSVLTINGAPNSLTVAENNNFNLGVNVTNPQSEDILTSYALTIPSGLTRTDGDSETGTKTVFGGGTRAFSWTIKHNSCFTGTKTITLQLGDNSNAFSTDVSGNSSCGSSSSSNSSSSSSGIGSNLSLATKESKIFSASIGGKQTLVFLTVTSPGITQIEITAAGSITNANITLAPGFKPSGASDPLTSAEGIVYSYAEITKSNVLDSDFSSIKIRFKVPAVWLSANKIDQQKIYLYRWSNNAWNRLTTTFKSNDSSSSFYEAETPGFSTFAVGGYKSGTSVPNSTVSGGAASIAVISPTSGMKIAGSTVDVQLSASGITLAAPKGNVVSGEAHFRVMLDDTKEQSGPATTFTFINVSDGNHTLKVELRSGNYSALDPPVSMTVQFETVAEVQQASADLGWLAYVVLIALVVAAGAYFFHVKKLSLPTFKYFSHKNAENARDFTPMRIREAISKEMKAIRSAESSWLKSFMKSLKHAPKNFTPENIKQAVVDGANTVAQTEGDKKEEKKEPEGGYSFAS